MKTDASKWAEALTREIQGDVIPPRALSTKQLAAIWQLSPKGTYNEAIRRVEKGQLVSGKKKLPGGQRAIYFWPKEK